MFYEVFIPSTNADEFDVTITVEADNWMLALKSGLERTGSGADIRNVMCDIKDDNTIHVTDATTRRVFVLRELDEEESEAELEQDAPAAEEARADEDDASMLATQKMEAVPTPSVDEASPTAKFDRSDARTKKQFQPPPATHQPPPSVRESAANKAVTQTKTPASPPPGAAPPPSVRQSQETRAAQPSQQTKTAPPPNVAPPDVVRKSGAQRAVPPVEDQPRAPQAATDPVPQPAADPVQPPSRAAATQAPPAATPQSERRAEPAPSAPTPAQTDDEAVHRARQESWPQSGSVIVSADSEEPLFPDAPEAAESSELGAGESWTSDDGRMRIGSSTFEALRRDEPEPRVLRETRAPSGQREAIDIGRASEAVSQSTLEEVFLEINQIHEQGMSMEQVINFVMDLCMSKIVAEAGSIMFADVNGRELYFATARGPKAHAVMDFRVPMGKGIAGFCAREGVSLAISDAENDPRFYRDISDALGYETKNICCAPIQFEGRVYGCIELMNKSQPFTNTEVNVLTYVGRQLAKFVHDLIMAREKLE